MSLGIVRWHNMNSLLRTRAAAANENNGMIEPVTWNIYLRAVHRFLLRRSAAVRRYFTVSV
jgi:hypothetical protein